MVPVGMSNRNDLIRTLTAPLLGKRGSLQMLVFGSILGVLLEVSRPMAKLGPKSEPKKSYKNERMKKSGDEKPNGVSSIRTTYRRWILNS